MEGLEKLLTSELGIFLVCMILIIREFRGAFVEWLKSKKGGHARRESDFHIKETQQHLGKIKEDMKHVKENVAHINQTMKDWES